MLKLFQSLKLKNKIIGEIINKKSLLAQHNSHAIGETNYYDCNVVFEEIRQHIKDLIALKTAINVANVSIQSTIYELAEAKTMINLIKSLNTQEGKIKSGRIYAGDTENEYAVSINELTKNNLAEEYQTIIDTIQDKIDLFNHVTDCQINEQEFLIFKKKK
jgi:hypothetical protein